MKSGQIRVLNEQDVLTLLDMPTVLKDVETALKEHAQGSCVNPMKLHLSLRPEIEGYMNSMPAYLKEHEVMGAKLVSVYKHNANQFGLPVTMGTIVLQRPQSGLPFAVVAGTRLTSLRTGAAAGIGAKYLAKEGTHVALQIGAGAQGYMGARAILTAVPAVDQLRVADPNGETLQEFAASIRAEFPHVTVTPFTDYRGAIPGAEIICASTTAPMPLLRGQTLDKGTTVLMIAELADNGDLKGYDRCVLDFPECFCDRINDDLDRWSKRTGLPYEPIEESVCSASLGEVIAGLKPGRQSQDDIIAAGFVGMGIEDVMVAKTAFDRAERSDSGVVLDFFC